MKKILLLSTMLFATALGYSQEKMEVEGAIIIKDSEAATPDAGTIQWNGADFVGWNGQRWVSLTGYATVGSMTDIDGNTYETTRVDNQEWMTENLRVTKYNDDTVIDHITDSAIWVGLSTGAWCWYDNTSSYETPYGKLYNWYAVNTGKLCPAGWHVPTDAEWTILTDYLGGSLQGGKMKETGTTHWNSPNNGATNESGFTGLPGGYRSTNASFFSVGYLGNWWSSTESSSSNAWDRDLYYFTGNVARYYGDKRLGYSVRCIRD